MYKDSVCDGFMCVRSVVIYDSNVLDLAWMVDDLDGVVDGNDDAADFRV